MTFDEYQTNAAKTSKEYEEGMVHGILITALGLAGEGGEVADYLKKVYGHGHKLDIVKLKKELGDALWYISDLCTRYNISLDEVASLNNKKLEARYPEGFSQERSVNRSSDDV